MTDVPFDMDQEQWGSRLIYPDDPTFTPRFVVIHWGGGTSQIPADSEDDRLRIWQAYHIDSKGWRDIAYNYAVGDSGLIYRLRGATRGGHVKCGTDVTPEGDSYCDASYGIVWIGGANDTDGPSPQAHAAMARIINTTGLEVKGHRAVKQENGSWTACPGGDWLAWIEQRQWEKPVTDDRFLIGTEDPTYEPIVWALYAHLGGVKDFNGVSAQVRDLMPWKQSVRVPQSEDFHLVADLLGLSDDRRVGLVTNGLYKYGIEVRGILEAGAQHRHDVTGTAT